MSWSCSEVLVVAYLADCSADTAPSAPSKSTHTVDESSCNDRMMASCPHSQSGTTSELLTESDGEALLTWYVEDFLARTFLPPVIERARLERSLNREIIADKLKGEMNRFDSESRIKSQNDQAELAKSMLSAKSGMDRMKAVASYRAEEDFNRQTNAMQKQHKLEMEALLDRGGKESERMALEDRQNEEQTALNNAKSIGDAIRDSVGDVGGIRGLVGEQVGGTSSIVDAWKQREKSSFSHIKDPVSDAIELMSRDASKFHASLLGFMFQQLPGLFAGQASAQVNMVQNLTTHNEWGLA